MNIVSSIYVNSGAYTQESTSLYEVLAEVKTWKKYHGKLQLKS